MSPAIPGPAPALDLDAVSDYVPGLDDGLALDYGPAPDSDAARDYGKALDYDAPSGPAEPPGAQAGVNVPGPTAPAPHDPLVSGPAPTPDDPLVSGPAPARGSVLASGPAPAPGSVLAPGPASGPAAVPVPDSVPEPDPVPAGSAAPAGALPAGAAPAGEHREPDPADARISPATYWRRRVLVLVVGIAVLTVLAWAASGVLHGAGGGQSTGHSGRSPAQRHAGHGSGKQPGRRAGKAASPQALSTASGRAHTATAGHAALGKLTGITDVLTLAGTRQQGASAAPRTPHRSAAHPPGHYAAAPAPARPAPARPADAAPAGAPHAAVPQTAVPHVPACGHGDVVLSLVSPRQAYKRGRWPLFGVDAVSTGTRPCRFNMGSRFATVVVSSGRARIWGSADCVHGAGSHQVVLSRGVPAVRWIYWDRATSMPGCRRPGSLAHQGAYTAIAFDGQLSSQVMVFLLRRPGSYLP